MLRRFSFVALISVLFSAVVFFPSRALGADEKTYTAEQIVETTIAIYGGRQVLSQIRRNGDERGRLTRTGNDGRVEDVTYERRFIRGETTDKDKVRLDKKTPTIEYSLLMGGGKMWGIINGAVFTPREDASAEFMNEINHGIESLLRYKENGGTITLVGKEKHKNVEVFVIDLTDKDNLKTRYFISATYFRVSWLEYEAPATTGGTPVKFARRFYDYHSSQGTLVPFRSILLEDGKVAQESRIQTITFGVKLDDSIFQNPDAQTSSANP